MSPESVRKKSVEGAQRLCRRRVWREPRDCVEEECGCWEPRRCVAEVWRKSRDSVEELWREPVIVWKTSVEDECGCREPRECVDEECGAWREPTVVWREPVDCVEEEWQPEAQRVCERVV